MLLEIKKKSHRRFADTGFAGQTVCRWDSPPAVPRRREGAGQRYAKTGVEGARPPDALSGSGGAHLRM